MSGRASAPPAAPAAPYAVVLDGLVGPVSEPLRLTIVYEDGDGWVVASVPEVPGVHSQGRGRDEARANVVDALRGILELRFGGHPSPGGANSERLELIIAA